MAKRDRLYGWLFHYNPYRNQWEAAKREHYKELFSGGKHVLRSRTLETLKDLIMETNGDPKKIMILVG